MKINNKLAVQDHIYCILERIGEDPTRKGLIDTPKRVANAYMEIFRGYDESQKPKMVTFPSDSNTMILKKNIPFYSICEHHMLPYYGVCHVGYIPSGKEIVGMSKITKLVRYLAAKLTVQETLTKEIADEFNKILKPEGVAITTKALHLCEGMRGAKVPNSEFEITELRGLFRKNEGAQNEFIMKTVR